MAYTPINWAENLGVDATKLDKMDNQIDANEQRLTDIDNKATGTVTEDLQGQITRMETFTAGGNYIYQDNTTVTGVGWEKVKGATVYKNGTIRVYFQFRDIGDSSTTAYARIKKNGNVIQSYTRGAESFGTITRDLSISIGDKITLEVDSGGFNGVELRNFRLGINRESDLIVTS